jgi:hypothetical protein
MVKGSTRNSSCVIYISEQSNIKFIPMTTKCVNQMLLGAMGGRRGGKDGEGA